ncbi:MAG TPA: hypothetical protein VF865_15095, partial [Acidobacteriaceae bacterium]
MAIIHISEAEAALNFAAIMAKVRAGEEVRIDNGSETVAVLRALSKNEPRMASDILASLKSRASDVTLPSGFA